jgi:hypothetical protein
MSNDNHKELLQLFEIQNKLVFERLDYLNKYVKSLNIVQIVSWGVMCCYIGYNLFK